MGSSWSQPLPPPPPQRSSLSPWSSWPSWSPSSECACAWRACVLHPRLAMAMVRTMRWLRWSLSSAYRKRACALLLSRRFALAYAGGLALSLAAFRTAASTAALRGSFGRAPPRWLDVGLRLFFFVLLCWPLALFLPASIPFMLAYLFLSYLDGSERSGHGRANSWLRGSAVWRVVGRRIMDVRLVKTADLPSGPDRQYLFALHPHGILPLAGVGNLATDMNGFSSLFPGLCLRGLSASFCFYIPLYRDLCLGLGLTDASRPHARRLLRHGYSVFVVPGGATEALYASPHADELQLSNRRGFVRLALSTGARLVPVFSFGETDTFRQWAVADRSPTIARFTAAFQRVFGVSLPLLTSPVPRRVPITTVVGAPVELVPPLQPGHPTDEEVACSLARYTVALTELYETHKHRYNCDPAKRLIIR